MGGSASDARWVVRARTHLCRTTADARRRSRPRTQQALHSRWNFTALEELCTLVVPQVVVSDNYRIHKLWETTVRMFW